MKMLKTIPAIPVQNINDAVAYYEDNLGFMSRHKEESFAILIRDEVEIHLWAASDYSWKYRSLILFIWPIWNGAESFLAGTVSCRIAVENIHELFSEYKANGVLYSSSTVVEETAWGSKEFPAVDLHRNLLTFYEAVKQ